MIRGTRVMLLSDIKTIYPNFQEIQKVSEIGNR